MLSNFSDNARQNYRSSEIRPFFDFFSLAPLKNFKDNGVYIFEGKEKAA
jgi:hypothetical protein|tara:strand:+ start:405 stop:551 length:147 start_codon:yes stop_codon:yes gene_type:complete